MSEEEAVRVLLERLVDAENKAGKKRARLVDEEILDPGFLGITRGTGREQDRASYLDELSGADANPKNTLRWLDIADGGTAPDLVEPGGKPRDGSKVTVLGETAVARAVVATRSRQRPSRVEGRWRNIFVLKRGKDGWRLLAWQVTELDQAPKAPAAAATGGDVGAVSGAPDAQPQPA